MVFLFKLSIMGGVSCILHYLIPENQRFLPLRTYLMIALLISLCLVVFPPHLGIWGLIIVFTIILAFSFMLSYSNVSLNQRRNQLQSIINIVILGLIGPLLAMNHLLIAIITTVIISSLLWTEKQILNKECQPQLYRMVFQLHSMAQFTTINRILSSFKCKILDQKMIKNDQIYMDVHYESSPLTQQLLMRQFLQLNGVKELIQY